MPRPSKDEWALQIASVVATRGTCFRRKVGCVLLDKSGRVLATGYNGRPAGMNHCNSQKKLSETVDHIVYPYACSSALAPSGTHLEGCEAIHAEQNALLQCADVREIDTCYTTTEPCMHCTKLLLNTGCRRVVFRQSYPSGSACKALWLRARPNLQVPQLSEDLWQHIPG